MTIIDAAKKMNEGFKVQRKSWPSSCHIYMSDGDGQEFPSIVTEVEGTPMFDTEDMLADDWEISSPSGEEK